MLIIGFGHSPNQHTEMKKYPMLMEPLRDPQRRASARRLISTCSRVPSTPRRICCTSRMPRRSKTGFAEAVYRTAIADGIMEDIAYQDPPDTGDAGGR
jgi:hypothetical protein